MRHLFFLLLTASTQMASANPFHDYIRKCDLHYSWKVVKTFSQDGVTGDVIELTSQEWREPSEVSETIWRHSLLVVRPSQLKSSQALLFIGGGRGKDESPTAIPQQWVQLARSTGSVIAEIRNIPNQPLRFMGEAHERSEDDLVAYSWKKAMTTGDLTWSVRMPMVKSVIKAMDTVQALVAQHGSKVDGFVVAGASKRGWTSWLTAAMDSRVVAVVPMVIDVLNVQKTFLHMREVYGFYPPALRDYVEQRMGEDLLTPEFAKLMAVEDPYAYRDVLSVPKYIINATGDRYFLPDSSQFYFHDLKGPKYLRYMPNVDHHMDESDAYELLQAFYTRIVNKEPMPEISWQKREDGALIVKSHEKPSAATLWYAHNAKARDFRMEAVGQAFKSVLLQPELNGTFVGIPPRPAQGYTAYFVELAFGGEAPVKLTTDVIVTH